MSQSSVPVLTDLPARGPVQQHRVKTFDPQIEIEGTLKEGPKSDVIVFSFNILLFELTFIVTIPEDGKTTAPVYVKHKIRRNPGR